MPVTLVKSKWSSGNLVFEQVTSGAAIEFGVNGTGLDIKFWGDTASSFMLWDESLNALSFASGTTLAFGGSTISTEAATITMAAGGKLIVASTGLIDLSADVSPLIFMAGASTTKTPTADAPAGWINVHILAASAAAVAIPYYAIT